MEVRPAPSVTVTTICPAPAEPISVPENCGFPPVLPRGAPGGWVQWKLNGGVPPRTTASALRDHWPKKRVPEGGPTVRFVRFTSNPPVSVTDLKARRVWLSVCNVATTLTANGVLRGSADKIVPPPPISAVPSAPTSCQEQRPETPSCTPPV